MKYRVTILMDTPESPEELHDWFFRTLFRSDGFYQFCKEDAQPGDIVVEKIPRGSEKAPAEDEKV